MAWLAPIALRNGKPAEARVTQENSFRIQGHDGWQMELGITRGQLVLFDVTGEIEGPVLRLSGEIRNAVFPGVEFLGRGERSSSQLDIETDEHVRYAPDPIKVTAPYMAAVTSRGGA